MDDEKLIRLNKFISNSGHCNRREADNFIVQGRVTVNDKVIVKLGTKVSVKDDVKLDGNNISLNKPVYIILNKPKGFHSINLDNKKNIFSLLPFEEFHDLQSLDFMNENYMGLMIFSNNQDFIKRMSDKVDNLKQLFHVILDSDLKEFDKESIKNETDFQIKNINHVGGASKNEIGLELSIKQVKDIEDLFLKYSYKVISIDRVLYSNISKKDLPRGKWRHFKKQELINLQAF
jgi:23S rRNA pseudouridine2605 synthase|tara:strand:- start:868 stop:1566 length:699 start_codon:yes stop_codon:yes gene_type:complete